MASRSWNRVELIGNLTRDPELRYTPNGAAVCTFGLATNRTFVSEGERREEVDFHRLVAWNKLAELCSQLLKKGMKVFISGRLQTRSWEGQDGQTRQVTEIVIEDMIILTPKGNGPAPASEGLDIDSLPASRGEPTRQVEETPKAKEPEEKVSKVSEVPKVKEKPEEPAKEDIKNEEVEDLPF